MDYNSKSRKLSSIQELRAIAIFLVVLVHSIGVIDSRFEKGIEISRGLLSSIQYFNEFGSAGVDLFFVISGFIMANMLDRRSGHSVSSFVKGRFIRIVPLYWLASAVFVLVLWGIGRKVTGESVIAALTLVPVGWNHYESPILFVGWSLAFELVFYALVALVLLADRWRVALLAAMVLVLAMHSIVMKIPAGMQAVVSNPIQLEFLFGILVFWVYRHLPTRRWTSTMGKGLVLVGWLTIAMTVTNGYHFSMQYLQIIEGKSGSLRSIIWGMPWALVVLGSVLQPYANLTKPRCYRRWLNVMGDASYAIYLSHIIICVISEELTPSGIITPDFLIAVTLTCGMIFGIACHFYVEKPVIRGANRCFSSLERYLFSISPPVPPEPSGPVR